MLRSSSKSGFDLKPLPRVIVAAVLFLLASQVEAQNVNVTSTAGTILSRSYLNLKLAFDGINSGDHQGVITVSIVNNTNEGTTPAVLNSGDAFPASYTSVTINAGANAVSVSGTPAAGFGVIELNGADNVIINGDNPATAGTARNLTINNNSAATNTNNSVIRIATSLATISANNISIRNLNLNGNVTNGNESTLTNTTTQSNLSYGIYVGGEAGVTDVSTPGAINVTDFSQSALSGTTINNLSIENNQIDRCGRGIMINSSNSSVMADLVINNNSIGNPGSFTAPYTLSPATTVYVKGITVSGVNSMAITRNTVKNIISFVGTSIAGIELFSNNGNGSVRIDSNTVNTIISNTNTVGNTGQIANGISINSVNGPYSVTSNELFNIETYGNFFPASGIEINANGAAGILSLNRIYQISGKNQSSAFGITLRTAANGMQIQNNFIYNLQNIPFGAVIATSRVVAGININSGSNHKIYHNSIHLFGNTAVNLSNITTCLITRSAAYTGLDIRNNIFSNEMTTANTASVHSCLFMTYNATQAAASVTNMTLNNNAYYTGSVTGVHGIGFFGTGYNAANLFSATDFNSATTTPATNWRSYSTLLGNTNNDNLSIASSGAAPFLSDNDLHIDPSPSPLESGGADLDVNFDFDNEPRNANTPDIGADEFINLPIDNFPPTISIELLPGCTTTRELFATINDASGVIQDGTGSDPACPQLYWKIGVNGTYQVTPGFWVGENLYFFSFGGGNVNDTIYYYIVAQDQASTPNLVAFPSLGAGGYTPNIPAASTPPTTPLSYINRAALNGTYLVGPGAPAPPLGYPTLTAAVAAYNTACLGGPVTFLLKNGNYTSLTGEIFPIVINQNEFANNFNILTIKPEAGANPIIDGGSPDATIKLNGSDYVVIDGSNTVNGTSRNLIISNNSASNTASTIWISSASSTKGSTNNVIKNCEIAGNGNELALSQACITSSSGTSVTLATQFKNKNNTISNNKLRGALFGINILGKSSDLDSNWIINNNDCGNISSGPSGTFSQVLGRRGISLSNVFNFTIHSNNISNVVSPSAGTVEVSGIFITGNSSNGNIFKNKVNQIRSNSTSLAAYSLGLSLGSGNTNSNINVYNNFIWDIHSNSNYTFSPTFNSVGIYLRSGGGYNLYYNTVSLNTNQNSTSGGVPTCIYITGISGTNSVKLANNIFSNTQSLGRRYAIYTTSALTAFGLLDNNDYYVASGGNVGFIGSLNRPTLVNWQSATGPTNDINSVSVNPLFLNITNDLHLNALSPLNALGRVINSPSITTDIDDQSRNTITRPDIGADEFTAPNCLATGGATISVSVSNICVGGTGSLIGTGFQLGEGMTYQWEKSTNSATGPWTNLVNGNNPNGAPTGFINQTTWFKLTSTCSFSGTSSSNVVVVNVYNPTISGLPDTARRCGPGTVTITGTPSANAVISWYTVPTGGSPIGTGSPFVTPLVTAPTTFYASARTNPPVYIPDLVNRYNFSTDTTTVLDTLSGPSVQTLVPSFVDDAPSGVFNLGTGFTFNYNNTDYTQFSVSPDGWILMGGNPAAAQYINSINSTTNIPKIAPFWDDMATGGDGSVKSLLTGTAPNRILKVQWKLTTTANHPAGLATYNFQAWLYEGSNKIEFYYGAMGSISTGASIGLTGSLNNYQSVTFSTHTVSTTTVNNANNGTVPAGRRYTFTPPVCESPRIAVPVALSTPPAINAPTATPNTICDGESTTLNVTSSHAPYTYVWTPGNVSGASQTLFPTSTTVYTVTATDNTPGPTFGCANIASVQVNVNRSPTLINIVSSADSICAGQTVNLSATGGLIQGDNIYSSGAVNLVIPDAGCANPAISTIAVPVLPPGATVDSVIVELNTTSSSGTNADLVFQIRAPNGQILTLKSRGASGTATGNNFTGTRFTSNPSAPPLLSATAPYTGTFSGDYQPTASGASCSAGVTPGPTTTTWSSLLTQVNGNWDLICHDAWGIFVATLTNWSIKIAYTAPSVYNWTSTPATTITGTPSAPSVQVTATPLATTNFFATVSNGTCSRRDTATVVIRQPVATVTITQAPSGAICPGTSVTFTATPTNGGTAPTYQWFNGVTAIPGATSATYVTNTLTNGTQISCKIKSNAACVNPVTEWTSNTINVTVNPNLPADVTIVSNDTDSTICPGTSVTFTATPTNGGAAPVYQWQVNGVNVGTNNAQYITTSLNNGDVVRVIMTSNATPCLTNSPDTSNPIPFTVIPSAPVSVTITGDNNGQTICVGSEVNFTATPVNPGTTPSYQWQINGVNVGTNSSTYTSSSLNNNDQIRVILTSNASCSVSNPDTSNVITMTVTNNAQAVVNLSSGTPCAGQQITLTANPTNQGTAPVYQFFVNGTQVQSGSSATYTYTPTSGDQAYVVLISNILCPDPNVDTSSIVNITNAAAPVIDATTNCNSILTGSDQQATLTITATTATGTITGYQWFQNGTAIPGATTTTYTTPIALAAGTYNYTVNVTNSNGCVTIDTVVITSAASALTPGIYTIPSTTCTGFPSIAKAVTYFNTNGINTATAGGIIFDITPGYAETAPAGGFRITRSGGPNNQVIFRRGGVGDVTLTAFTPQTSGQIYDAIIKLVGADYISIRGLKLQENPANFTIAADTVTATNKMTEWGIALLKSSNTDGAQHDSIDLNTITLNRLYQNSFGIYSSSTHAETTPGSLAPSTSIAGLNSFNKVLSNNISNVNFGISFSSGSFANNFDSLNVIGNISAGGNIITNWGRSSYRATAFAGVPNTTLSAINLYNQVGETVTNNLINTTLLAADSSLRVNTIAINKTYNSIPTSNFTTNVEYNNIGISSERTQASRTFTLEGIRIGWTGTNLAPATINIKYNTLFDWNIAAGGIPTFNMIVNQAIVTNLNINNNIIKSFSSLATGAGSYFGINNSASVINVTIQGNDFGGPNVADSIITNSAAMTMIQATGNNTAKEITFNTISNVRGLTAITGITAISAPTTSVNNNSLAGIKAGASLTNGIVVSGATPAHLVSVNDNNVNGITASSSMNGMQISATGTNIISGNTVSNLTMNSTAGNLVGIQTGGTHTTRNNTISGLNAAAAGASTNIWGIFQSGSTAAIIDSNRITQFTSNATGGNGTTSGLVSGIYVAAGSSVTIKKNRIFNLKQLRASISNTVNGLHVQSGTTVTATNNYISDLRADSSQNPDGIRGISVTSTAANSNYYFYYNTIYLNASSLLSGFGSSGVYHTGSATLTTANMVLRNNIITNVSTPSGAGVVFNTVTPNAAGLTVALRRSTAAFSNYGNSPSSNYNAFYAGTPATNRLLYFNGTTSAQTITAVRTAFSPSSNEANSIAVLPQFVNSTTTPYDLHLISNLNCNLEGTGNNSIILVPNDFDGDSRSTTAPFITDIGADEFTGTTNASPVITTQPSSASENPCFNTAATALTVAATGITINSVANGGLTYQWYSNTVASNTGGTLINGATSASYTPPTTTVGTTYYYVVVNDSCAVSPTTSSVSGAITVKANTTITTEPTASVAVCQNATATAISVVATGDGAVTYQWYSNTTNTYTGATSLGAVAQTASYTPSVSTVGTTYYFVIATSTCGSDTSVRVTYTVNSLPIEPTFVDGIRCGPGSVSISATPSVGETISWYTVATGGTSIGTGSPFNTPAITVSTFYFAEAVNSTTGCRSAIRSLVNANIVSTPTISNAGPDQNLCSTTATLAANTATSGTGVWSVISGAGGSFANTASPTTTFTGVSGTTYTLAWTISNAPCPASADQVVITLTAPPTGALSGVYYVPSSPLNDCRFFATIAEAVTYLNNNGVAGATTIKVAAGYTENLTATLALGSATLNASTSSTNKLRFEKDGTGANPLVTAYTGGTNTSNTASPDGIWSLRGVDYVTIDGISLQENPANVNANTQMEYGFGLFKTSATDGAQNDTIKNCAITLNRNNFTGSTNFLSGAVGIAMVNATATAAITPLVVTALSGANSNNVFISNNIQNVHYGIGLLGFATSSIAAFGDASNKIGDTTIAASGNTIDAGGSATANNVSYGVFVKEQFDAQIGYNTISGSAHNSNQTGIRTENNTGATGIGISNNTISITGGADRNYAGIDNTTGGGSGSTVAIEGNTINVSMPSNITLSNTLGSIIGVRNASVNTIDNIRIRNNNFSNSNVNGTGAWTGISNTANSVAVGGTINISNNTLNNNKILSTGTFAGIQNTGTTYASLEMSRNVISGNRKDIGNISITDVSWLKQTNANANSGNLTVQNNLISNDTVLITSNNNQASNVNGISIGGVKSGSNSNVSANTIQSLSLLEINSTFVGTLRGISLTNPIGQIPTGEVISNNRISKLVISAATASSATHVMAGIQHTGIGASPREYSSNRIDTMYVRKNADASPAYNSLVSGIHNASGGSSLSIFKNKISHLIPFASTNATIARGIWIAGGATLASTLHNNMVDLDMTQAFDGAEATSLVGSDAIRGFDISTGSAGPINVYYNTVEIAGSGTGTVFGSSAFSINNGTPSVLFKNNAFVNRSTPGGTSPGLSVALRRSTALSASYSTSSSNNLYFAGTPSATNLIYFDGTNSFQRLSDLQPTRELNSVELVNPVFVRGSDNTDSLHMNTTTNCAFNGTATPIVGFTDDVDGDVRSGTTPDIGADEFNTTGLGVGQWAGINTNWNDANNWCGAVPNSTTDVTLATGRTFYPSIDGTTTPIPAVRNLTINNGATVNVLANGKMDIYGNITNSGIFNTKDGTIEMTGSSAQTIAAGTFQNNNLRNLVLNNNVTLNGALNILNKISFKGNNRVFTTNDNLTLKSNDTLTASVGDATNGGVNTGNNITGNVSVERFLSNIKNGTPSLKTWRLLSMPTKHNLQTIKQSWQENGDSSTVFNPNPGFGTQITTILGGTNAAARLLGFDAYSSGGSSIKTYNPVTNQWVNTPTTLAAFDRNVPYLIFVRGSRAKTLFNQIPDTTVLREKGILNIGDTFNYTLGTAGNQFVSVPNPYPSSVSFQNLQKSNITAFYYLYDSRLGSNGGYQTVTADGSFITPGGGSYTGGNYNIQSGQGFFVRTNGGAGSILFKETAKVDGSANVLRTNAQLQMFKTSLYKLQNGTPDLNDGVVQIFDENANNNVDESDAEKMSNLYENFGISGNGKNISIESRKPFEANDTVHYNMGQMKLATYRLEFAPQNLIVNGLEALLLDKFLGTTTPVSLQQSTTVDFTVNSTAGSYASDRFKLIFRQLRPLPVTFIEVKAVKVDKQSKVSWKVANEINISGYTVERSLDGRTFAPIGTVSSNGRENYSLTDVDPSLMNYYRIRSNGTDGDKKYSQIVKLVFETSPSITIYPNPIKEDGKANIRLISLPQGEYNLTLLNSLGQTMKIQTLQHQGGDVVYPFEMPKHMAHGHYTLEINGKQVQKTRLKILF